MKKCRQGGIRFQSTCLRGMRPVAGLVLGSGMNFKEQAANASLDMPSCVSCGCVGGEILSFI